MKSPSSVFKTVRISPLLPIRVLGRVAVGWLFMLLALTPAPRLCAQTYTDADAAPADSETSKGETISFQFSKGVQGWYVGHGSNGPLLDEAKWPGCVIFPQTNRDIYILSPRLRLMGDARHVAHIRVYPEGEPENHCFTVFWLTRNVYWGSRQQSTDAHFTARNAWADATVPLNTPSWVDKEVLQVRFDFEDDARRVRWIVSDFEITLNPPYDFSRNQEGWAAGESSATLGWQGNVHGRKGMLVVRPAAHEAQLLSPWVAFDGKPGDDVHVSAYPECAVGGTHNLRLRWITRDDQSWDDAKSTPLTAFGKSNEWQDVPLNVRENPKWANKTIVRMRLDLDSQTTGVQWLVGRVDIPR